MKRFLLDINIDGVFNAVFYIIPRWKLYTMMGIRVV